MSDVQNEKRSKRVMAVAVETVRDEVRFMVRRMSLPIEPHETSVKAQHNKVARITGLPPRRVKDLWYGAVTSIPAHQDRTIRDAYRQWLESSKALALANLQRIETEHAELTRTAAEYSSARWRRAVETRTEIGPMGDARTAKD